jgi:hypothetical protein
MENIKFKIIGILVAMLIFNKEMHTQLYSGGSGDGDAMSEYDQGVTPVQARYHGELDDGYAVIEETDIIIAVCIISFTGIDSARVALLKWDTDIEINIKSFIIYKSLDKNGRYNKIATINAEGSGTYTYVDTLVDGGYAYWYKLFTVNEKNEEMFDTLYSAGPISVKIRKYPKYFFLKQNLPNPFSKVTSIEYGLPKTTHVRIEVYNVAGQRVVLLLDKKQEPGFYTIKWEGKDNKGKEVSTGIYFYRLKTKEFISTKKFLKL